MMTRSRVPSPSMPNRLWLNDIERREALFNRVEVKDLHRAVVAAAG
jgi:hypothetical protein